MIAPRVVRNESEEVRIISALAQAMRNKLAQNRNSKPHWRTESIDFLVQRLLDEVEELINALEDGDSSNSVLNEAADIANIAAMIADVYLMEE